MRSCIPEDEQQGGIFSSDQVIILEEIAKVRENENTKYYCEKASFSKEGLKRAND